MGNHLHAKLFHGKLGHNVNNNSSHGVIVVITVQENGIIFPHWLLWDVSAKQELRNFLFMLGP